MPSLETDGVQMGTSLLQRKESYSNPYQSVKGTGTALELDSNMQEMQQERCFTLWAACWS